MTSIQLHAPSNIVCAFQKVVQCCSKSISRGLKVKAWQHHLLTERYKCCKCLCSHHQLSSYSMPLTIVPVYSSDDRVGLLNLIKQRISAVFSPDREAFEDLSAPKHTVNFTFKSFGRRLVQQDS